jgi:hypothetical protein
MNYPLMYPDYPFAIVIYIVLENKGRETYRKLFSARPPYFPRNGELLDPRVA